MAKSKTERKSSRRNHRAAFPTPGFYLFSFLLNLISLPLLGILLWSDLTNSTLWALTLVSTLGVTIAIYSSTLRPKESNKKTRKILVAATAGYGLVVLAVTGISLILTPGLIISM